MCSTMPVPASPSNCRPAPRTASITEAGVRPVQAGSTTLSVERYDREVPSRAATLQSVADAAGVHRSTAASALNATTSHLISAEVVTRVQEVAQ